VREHVISVYPKNVTPTEDRPETFRYCVSCACGRRSKPIWTDRKKAEAFGEEHLAFVGSLRMSAETQQAGHTAPKAPQGHSESGGAL